MTICYLNITQQVPPRDIVYLRGLRENGVKIIECRDSSPGLKKFWCIFKKQRAVKNDYDILWVGYTAHILVPFARLISRKKIVFNALASLYEGLIVSRSQAPKFSLRTAGIWFLDFLAFHCADIILAESNEQKKCLVKKFFLSEHKLVRAWTGTDEKVFYYDSTISKLPIFTVLFRGGLLPESGVEYAIEAARILKNKNVNFRIIGEGIMTRLVEKKLAEYNLPNVEWIRNRLNQNDLRVKMQECQLSLGQLSDHDRLKRTIPHKAFESIAMRLPYLTARNKGILELLKENETCFCCNPADAQDLADKIMAVKQNFLIAQKIADNAYDLFQEKLTSKILAQAVLDYLADIG